MYIFLIVFVFIISSIGRIILLLLLDIYYNLYVVIDLINIVVLKSRIMLYIFPDRV